MARPIISMIAAIGSNREIGKKGKLIWSLQDDMAYFVENTKGKVIIMGRKTFADCIGHALADRINIVVTSKPGTEEDGVFYVKTVKEAVEAAKAFCTLNGITEIVFIGGELTYKHGMRYADALYITHVEANDPDADSFFPLIDPALWKPVFANPSVDKETGIKFTITGYTAII